MGQGQSQSQQQGMSVDDMYSLYIQQQQNLIVQQQQQINELYQINLQQPSHGSHQADVPPNIAFQQQQQQQQHHQQQQANASLRKLPSTKLDPYKVLDLPKQFNENQLKKAYLKKAMKVHPDRGGSKDEFQKVSIAYTVLKKKLKEREGNHSHNELKSSATSFLETQPTQNMTNQDNFDVKVFNKIYTENRLDDPYDKGYGSWMEEETEESSGQGKLFQGEFNKDMFNHEFEKYKHDQKQKLGNQIVHYEEPQERLSMKNQDSLVTLGQDKVTNFSGETNGLGFSDYKAAFTTDTTLIDTGSVDLNSRATSIKGVEHERTNISYQMTSEDQQKSAYQEALRQKEERRRVQRLQVYDQQGEDMYHKVHQMLLR
jgi:curved DNA-binding protein CbpA